MYDIHSSTADKLVRLHFAIGVRGHSSFGHIIINVLRTIPVSTTLPPKLWTKNVAKTGSYRLFVFGCDSALLVPTPREFYKTGSLYFKQFHCDWWC